jgi:hypothetical protein
VDGLETQYENRLQIIRLDIQSEMGQELASLFGAGVTPTFLFFNPLGTELWRSIGNLDTALVAESLK